MKKLSFLIAAVALTLISCKSSKSDGGTKARQMRDASCWIKCCGKKHIKNSPAILLEYESMAGGIKLVSKHY